jgi:hypothetical protein
MMTKSLETEASRAIAPINILTPRINQRDRSLDILPEFK